MMLIHGELQAQATLAARDGPDILTRMRAAYDGKWYRTLTFVQQTTFHRPDGSTTTQRWYESIRGSTLRIDLDSATSGNGMLYTSDSTFVVRNGEVARRQGSGNPFLPLVMGVYLQPVERTSSELARVGMDLSRLRTDTWRGRPAWVIGATSAADSTSPQFWVDTERLVVVRLIFATPTGVVYDADVGGYERIGGAWLGTRIAIRANGRLAQDEVYQDWTTDVPLDEALFDLAQWRTAPHWGRKGRRPPQPTDRLR
jgi:hypothetical protein